MHLLSLAFAAYCAARPDITFCFVNDGSTYKKVSPSELAGKGQGGSESGYYAANKCQKAEALRSAVLHALHGAPVDYVGFMDADLATPLREIDRLLSCCIESPPQFSYIWREV